MSNDEQKFQPIFQILHIKNAWFLLELAMALVTTIGMRFLQVWTDKKDVANKTKPKTNSANTIGAQVTIGFAVFLAVFNKVMAWIFLIMLLIGLFNSLKRSFWFLTVFDIKKF